MEKKKSRQKRASSKKSGANKTKSHKAKAKKSTLNKKTTKASEKKPVKKTPKQTKKPHKRHPFLLFITGIIVVTALTVGAELYSNNKVFLNTSISGVKVGGLPFSEAIKTIEDELKKYLYKPFIISFEGDFSEFSAEELGIVFSLDATASKIEIFNIKKNNPIDLIKWFFEDRNRSVVYKIDEKKAIEAIENRFHLNNRKARNAGFEFVGKELVITKETIGAKINSADIIGALHENVNTLTNKPIEIDLIIEQPRISAEELAPEKDRLIKLLKKPITLESENRKTTLNLLDHISAVSFEEQNSVTFNGINSQLPIILGDNEVNNNNMKIKSNIFIEVNPKALEEFLIADLIQYLEVETVPASIYKGENGEIIIDGKARDGKRVPLNVLGKSIALAVNNGISTVPVPVETEKAPITIQEDLKEMGITELIASGHSAYYGSPPNRMFNINFGTSKYNGILIKPGEEFSFNALLGPVEAGSGFKPEKVIKQDKLEMEYGGGICQVSTTMYRAALQAGLPITARKPHSWKVSYYAQSMGDGLDATIYPGVSDLKFINDTKSYILVQAYTEGAEIYFKFYGTSDGRITELDGPYGSGLTYKWIRKIIKDGDTKTEEIWSKYKPIPPPDEEKEEDDEE